MYEQLQEIFINLFFGSSDNFNNIVQTLSYSNTRFNDFIIDIVKNIPHIATILFFIISLMAIFAIMIGVYKFFSSVGEENKRWKKRR